MQNDMSILPVSTSISQSDFGEEHSHTAINYLLKWAQYANVQVHSKYQNDPLYLPK